MKLKRAKNGHQRLKNDRLNEGNLMNIPSSINNLKLENGQNYPKGVRERYRILVSFIKDHQEQLKVATNRDQLNTILSQIFETEVYFDQKSFAADVVTIALYPQVESILKSNQLANNVILYFQDLYKSLSLIYASHRMKLAKFYEDNRGLFDFWCNFIFGLSH